MRQRVVNCLGTDLPGGLGIWMARCDSTMTVTVQTSDGELPEGWKVGSPRLCSLLVSATDSACAAGGPGTKCLMICKADSLSSDGGMGALKAVGIDLSNLKNGIDDATRAKLEALGFQVETSEVDGARTIRLMKRDCAAAAAPSAEAGAEAAKVAVVPDGYALDQNYPNPFNPSTTIRFTIPQSERVKVEVINVLGRRVRTLVDATLPAGAHELQWDATSDDGQRVPSGTYMYSISAGDFTSSRTMTLLK